MCRGRLRKLAWVLLLFVPFVIFSSFRIGKRVRKTTRTGQDKLADISNILQETITGNRIVKAFGMECWETNRFRHAGERLFGANMRSVVAIALTSPIMEEIAAIAFALLLLWGRDLINQHIFTPGTYVAFLFAVFRLYDPIRRVAIIFNNNFQQARGASQEIFRFMDATDEVLEKPGAVLFLPFATAFVSRTSPSATTMVTATTRAIFCVTSILRCAAERLSPSSARAAPARPPLSICCRASST